MLLCASKRAVATSLALLGVQSSNIIWLALFCCCYFDTVIWLALFGWLLF